MGSIAISAMLGIWALLSGEFGDRQAQVLLTSLCTTAASLLCSPCAAAWERRRTDIAPALGMVCAVVGFAMLALAVWIEIHSMRYFDIAFSLIFASVTLAHISLLSMARVTARYRWIVGLGMLSSLGLGSLCVALLYWSYPPIWVWRLMGCLAIVTSASSAAIPVLHRISRDLLSEDRWPVRYCPGCGRRTGTDLGQFECPRCHSRFHIE